MDFRTVNYKIGHVRRSLAHDQAELVLRRREMAMTEFELTPMNGWPGSNDKARDAAKVATLNGDARFQNARDACDQLEYNILLAQAEISALEDERRGLEWSVRQRFLMHITGDEKFSDDVMDRSLNIVQGLDNSMMTQEEAYAALGVDIPSGPEDGVVEEFPF